MFLGEMREGQIGVISNLTFNEEVKTRLNDLGFCKGENVTCTKIAAMGSPILYYVRGSNIALRKTDANRIEVATNEQ